MNKFLCVLMSIMLALPMALISSRTVSAEEKDITSGMVSAEGSGYDLDGNRQTFSVATSGGTYYMYDAERNIRFYDAKGMDNSKTPITDYKGFSLLSNSSARGWSAEAVTYMKATAMIYDFYKDVLGHKGIAGGGEPVNIVLNATGKIGATSHSSFIVIYSENNMPTFRRTVEDLGQEFTHTVIANTAMIAGDNTGFSIDEAFAISMGLLISNELNGIGEKDQWLYSSDMNFKDPNLSGNAVKLNGKNYDSSDGVRYWQYYQNAGIFMHIIYSLWDKGIKDNNELAKFIYETYTAMGEGRRTEDSYTYDWSEVRSSALYAAGELKWTDTQKQWLNQAFDKARIPVNNLKVNYSVEKGKAIITGLRSPLTKTITIPEKVNGVPVTQIAEYALYRNEMVESIVFPDSVTDIGVAAMYGCVNLIDCVLPKGLTTIEDYLFGDCKKLTNIKLPESITEIQEVGFGGCLSLTSLTLPDNLDTLGWYAFGECSALEELIIPEKVKRIETRTFENCSALTTLYIPAAVTAIDENAFPGFYGTVYGEPDSYVQSFAAGNGIDFKVGKPE